jgi:hypothetical protein
VKNNALLVSVVAAILLTACGSAPIDTIDKSPVAAASVTVEPEENITNFTPVLECVGNQIAIHGSRRFVVGSDTIRNETGIRDGVPESGRTMLQSAFSTLSEYSNGKVVWAGWSSAMNNSINAGFAQENKVWNKEKFVEETPEFSINGAITQYERNIQKASKDAGLKILGNKIGSYAAADLSLLGSMMTLNDNRHANFAVYNGIQAKHIISIRNTDVDTGLMLADANIGGINFNVSMVRKEGVSAALMNLMQLGAIEITGKFYKDDFDYRNCLNPNIRKSIMTNTTWKKQFTTESSAQMIKKLTLKLQFEKEPEYGVPLLLRVSANDSAHLYCFYEMADKSMVRIFPNANTSNNKIDIGKSVVVPDAKMRVKVTPVKGDKESITCVASTVDISRIVTANSSATPSKSFSVNKLLSQLKEYISPSAYASHSINW